MRLLLMVLAYALACAAYQPPTPALNVQPIIRHDIVPLYNGTIELTLCYPYQNTWTKQRFAEPALGARFAIEDVQANHPVLANHTLVFKHCNSQEIPHALSWTVLQNTNFRAADRTNLSTGTTAFIGGVNNDVEVFADACARVSRTCVIPSAQDQLVRNRVRFPTVVSVTPSARSEADNIIKTILTYGWKTVAVIASDEDISLTFRDYFLPEAAKNGISIVSNQVVVSTESSYKPVLQVIRDLSVRIIVLHSSIATAVKVYADANDIGMFSSTYTWLVGRNAFAATLSVPASLRAPVSGTIGVASGGFDNAGAIASGFVSRADALLNLTSAEKAVFSVSYAYTWYSSVVATVDGIGALVQLKRRCLTEPSYLHCVSMKQTGEDVMLRELIANQTFKGTGGSFKLDPDNGLIVPYNVLQKRGDFGIAFLGFFSTSGQFTPYQAPLWPDGTSKTPEDTLIVKRQEITRNASLMMTFWVIAGIGIGVHVLILLGLYRYRSWAIIKINSPEIFSLTVVGSALLLSTIYFVQPENSTDCSTGVALITMGFTLFFGPLFLRMFRLYRLFGAKLKQLLKMKPKKHKSSRILRGLFGLLAVDAVILTVWYLSSPLERKARTISSAPSPGNVHIIEEEFIYACSSDGSVYLSALFMYKLLLLMFGVYISVQIRSVDLRMIGGGDANEASLSIYTCALLNAVILPAVLVIPDSNVNARFTFYSAGLIVQLSACMLILCGMKFYAIFQGLPADRLPKAGGRNTRVHPAPSGKSNSFSDSNVEFSATRSHQQQRRPPAAVNSANSTDNLAMSKSMASSPAAKNAKIRVLPTLRLPVRDARSSQSGTSQHMPSAPIMEHEEP